MFRSYECTLWIPERTDFGGCVVNLILPSLLLVFASALLWNTFFKFDVAVGPIRRHNPVDFARLVSTILLSCTLSIYLGLCTVKLIYHDASIPLDEYIGPGILAVVALEILILAAIERSRRAVESTATKVFLSFFLLYSFLLGQSVVRLMIIIDSNKALSLWNWFTFPVIILTALTWGSYVLFNARTVPVAVAGSASNEPHVLPETKAGLLSRLTFNWISHYVYQGAKQPLVLEDLPSLHPKEVSAQLHGNIDEAWSHEMHTKPPGKRSFITVLLKVNWKLATVAALFKIINDTLVVVSPLLLKRIVEFLDAAKKPEMRQPAYHGYGYATLMFLCLCVQSLALHQYFHRQFRLGMRLRSSIISIIYQKCLRISSGQILEKGDRAKASKTGGEIVNLMSVDAERIRDLMNYGHLIWSAPLQIILSLTFLFINVGVSALGGLMVAMVSIPVLAFVARRIKKVQRSVMAARDERLSMTSETLGGIRTIKMFSWESSFNEKVSKVRERELNHLWRYQLWSCASRLQWALAPILVTVFTFVGYALLGHELDAATAFFTVSMVNVLKFPMQLLPITINNWMEALVSCRRIQQYLETTEAQPLKIESPMSLDDRESLPLVEAVDADFAWGSGKALLHSVNLKVYRGELVAILGSTGCGKSGLLHGLMQDVTRTSGTTALRAKISYASQVPWVQNSTVRDNICFGEYFDKAKYENILEACSLIPDLMVLPARDRTEIGERGINLSGGQKQRISMARCLYRDADIYIFDDCFSALDANVCKSIFEKCFLRLLKHKTVLLVTHRLDLLPYFNKVIFIHNQTTAFVGDFAALQGYDCYQEYSTYTEDLNKEASLNDGTGIGSDHETLSGASCPDVELSNKAYSVQDAELSNEESEFTGSDHSAAGPKGRLLRLSSNAELESDDGDMTESDKLKKGLLVDAEYMEKGRVGFPIYWRYLKNGGLWAILMVLVSFIAVSGSQGAAGVWLSYWSDNPESVDSILGVATYGSLNLVQMTFVLFGFLFTALAGQNAAERFHFGLLGSILRAPVTFFDVTPLGRIVNRFAKDVYSVDEELPQLLNSVIAAIFNIFVVLGIIVAALPYLLIVIGILSVFYYMIQRYYIPSSRQLQRLDSTLRSPIFANFSETLDGVATIRAFQHEKRFHQSSQQKVDTNARAYYIRIASNRWLAIRLEFVGTLVVAASAFFAVLESNVLAAGLGGLAVSYALMITQNLSFIVRFVSNLETSIVSVERILEYSEKIPFEKDQPAFLKHSSKDWPPHGEISFENFCLRYRPELPLVLKGLTFKFAAGESIGIVGRTGAGKSSLMSAMLRLIEASEGRILFDGEDVASVNLHVLRSKCCVIPQSPTLFSGTIRFNVDPLCVHSDENIWNALERSHIKDHIMTLGDSPLDFMVEENGKNFSVGQRQMLCLARAVLRDAKIVLLDEATSVVDPQTDQLIQHTLQSEFKNCTLITIAHRIHTILKSDRVLVLDNGEVVELDTPAALFEKENGIFRSMCLESGVAQVEGQLMVSDAAAGFVDKSFM